MPEAVVIGAGPNGLVGANLLADEGWDVLVLEANASPGGAVRTAEVTAPGFRNDLFSAFYPLGVASPVLRALELERHGLRWCRSPVALAHPTPDGPAAVIAGSVDETAAALDEFAPGDGEAWRRLFGRWEQYGDEFLTALLSPFPPVGAGLRLARAVGPGGLLQLARFSLLSVRRLAEEEFRGAGGPLLLAGCALHTDLTPESAAGAVFGWLLCSLGQQVGFPVPEGGAQSITDALVARLESRGGRVECGARVTRVEVRNGRAVGVRVAGGRDLPATKAVLADVSAPSLYLDLVGEEHLPPRVVADLRRFEHGAATFKVDWALSGPIPWGDPAVRASGCVHLADSLDELSTTSAQLVTGRIPDRPFLLVGQMTTVDPSRSPAGTESVWAYTHVPRVVKGDAGGDLTGKWNEAETEAFARRMEERIESYAPGFRERILARHLMSPVALEAADANLVGGDVNGGTAQIHQQLVFRPTPGMGRPETAVAGLYLASASAHPGGGVHGACGANAARAALAREQRARRVLTVGGATAGVLALQRARARWRRR